MTEKVVQRVILEYLTLKNIFHWRNNTGASRIGNRFVKYGYPGSPDIICVIDGKFVGIEVKGQQKDGRWGRQSKTQELFQKKLEEAGGQYILAQCLDDVIEHIK